MKKITRIISQTALGISTTATLLAGKVMAAEDSIQQQSVDSARKGAEAARADGMPAELVGVDGVFTNITNTILYVVGVISVIMLIYGGLRYVVSGGDSKKVTDAKNTILYAIIGLIIAILSFAIVNFVLNSIGTNNS
ncbi:hypothetical protein IKG54_00415 [Candidatus Saccharibacteria bacterium]|nr:hypothetical protein [Candidatus Saccharibacteria bacterium]